MKILFGLAAIAMLVQAVAVPQPLKFTEAIIQTLNYEDAFITARTVETKERIIIPVGLIAAPRSSLRIGLHVKLDIFQHDGEDKFGRNIIVLPNQ